MAESHNYTVQRNFKYETAQNGKYPNLTEDEWKKRIMEEWTYDKLKANYIVYIFHDRDVDDNGLLKELHVHGCINFVDSIALSNASKLAGCSSEKNCKAISKKSNAYRYLLHITEQAIKQRKHLYDEDYLIYSIAPTKKCEYKKLIQMSEKDEDEKDKEKLIKKVIADIMNGMYGDGNPFNFNPMLQICANRQVAMIIAEKASYRRAIENAIEIKSIQYSALALNTSTNVSVNADTNDKS